MLLVQSVGGLLYERGEAVAVGPHDVFDVEVDAVVAVVLALAEEGSDHLVLSFRVAEEGVRFVVVHEGEERDDGEVRVFGGLQDDRLGLSAYKTVLVDLIPGWRDDVDLVFVGEEGVDGGEVVRTMQLPTIKA